MSGKTPFPISRRAFGLGAIAAGAAIGLKPGWAQAPKSGADLWRHLSSLSGEERKAVLEKGAAAEGGAVIYGALGIDRAKFLINDFNKAYPSLNVDFVRLTQADIPTRLRAEAQTGQTQCDMVISTVTYANVIADYLAPYEHSTWDRWDPRFLFGSLEQGWTSVVYELLPTTIAWRTDRGISEADQPKTLQDVQSPMWKGRAGATTQLEEFVYAMLSKYGEKDGMAQVEALAALDNKLVASNAALAESLGSGQVDMTWNFVAHRAYYLQKKGAPIDWVFMQPQFCQGVGISGIKDAPHPYTAALFLDHLLQADSMERLDKLEPGRIFGNRDGTYQLSLSDFPDLEVYKPLPVEEFARLNTLVEQTFIRRR